MNLYFDLFITFAKMGVCTFGGGLAMLPILQREVVEKKKWATDEELTDYYAIGQCTPGVIAVNTATFIGYKEKGTLGGIIATMGMIFPSLIIITVIAAFLSNFAHLPVVIHAFAGIRACVCVLIFNATMRLRKTTVINLPTGILFVCVFLLSTLVGLSPALLVISAGLVGLGLRRARGWQA